MTIHPSLAGISQAQILDLLWIAAPNVSLHSLLRARTLDLPTTRYHKKGLSSLEDAMQEQ